MSEANTAFPAHRLEAAGALLCLGTALASRLPTPLPALADESQLCGNFCFQCATTVNSDTAKR